MLSKVIDYIRKRYEDIEKTLSSPEIDFRSEKYKKLSKEYEQYKQILNLYEEFKQKESELQELRELVKEEKDDEMKVMIEEEIETLKRDIADIERRIRESLMPADPASGKSIIMEIRAGTGGEEAAIFAADIFRMYSRYAERNGWKLEILSFTPSDLDGYKEIIFSISGKDAYDKLKYESGTHRVQRIPITESKGRIHTSAVTVAVLPEVEEKEVDINPKDLRIETFRAQGHGGQHVNVTDSAVRITHIPTGIVVSCQDERSQIRNKEKALRILRARLKEYYQRQVDEEITQLRRSQIGSGDRSEKIRTYNFPQNRVTDHRINLTLYKLNEIMDGDLDELTSALKEHEVMKNYEELIKKFS